MLKEITPVNQIFNALNNNQTMTGTNVLTSVVSNVWYKDSVAIQLQWTGTPTGTFVVQGSLDYNPQLAQNSNQSGAPNNGTWTSLVLSSTPAASGSSGQALINLNQLGFPYIRTQYTNASGTGVLTGFLSAKSLG